MQWWLFVCLVSQYNCTMPPRAQTTLELATKVGGAELVSRLVEDLKDDSEPYRKMVMEARLRPPKTKTGTATRN